MNRTLWAPALAAPAWALATVTPFRFEGAQQAVFGYTLGGRRGILALERQPF